MDNAAVTWHYLRLSAEMAAENVGNVGNVAPANAGATRMTYSLGGLLVAEHLTFYKQLI